MRTRNVIAQLVLWPLVVSAQVSRPSAATPVPSDPLELVRGQVIGIDSPAGRTAALRLLTGARNNYALRGGRGHEMGYELKAAFTVNSGGQTEYDGAWQMEDIFVPNTGFRWAAQHLSGDYAITRISAHAMFYGNEPGTHVPLRLQEARAALFDPIANSAAVTRASIRTSAAVYQGVQLTCILLSDSRAAADTVPGRRWDESEDCIDPETGRLITHSQTPGRYYAYDYSNAFQLGGHVLPGKVIVTEGGRTITEIAVTALTERTEADPALFQPDETMQSRGWATELAAAQKIFADAPTDPAATSGAGPVCIFGVVTPSGQLAEAHSLQPSNPNSQAALLAAQQMSFATSGMAGPRPQQRFVFIVENFN